MGELAELQHLRRALRLPWPAVGARHTARGLALSRGRAGGRLRADDPESWRKVRKLLFLSDCLLAEAPPNVAAPEAPPPTPKKTPPAPLLRLLRAVEARADESTLIGRRARAALGALAPGAGTEAAAPTIGELFDALGVQADEGRAACREVALPVYARAVQSGIGRLSNSTAKQLERARKALQLDLSDTAGAHRDAFAAIAAKLAGTGRLDEDDREMLALIANACARDARRAAPAPRALPCANPPRASPPCPPHRAASRCASARPRRSSTPRPRRSTPRPSRPRSSARSPNRARARSPCGGPWRCAKRS